MQETPVWFLGLEVRLRRDRLPTPIFWGFPVGSIGKESPCIARDLGSIPGLGRSSGRGHDNPLQYSFLESSHEQRSLAGYSPWGCRVRHNWATKHTHTHTHTHKRATWGFPGGSAVKSPPVMQEMQVQSQGQEYLLEKEMASHSNTLACEIPWAEEAGKLQSMGSQKGQTKQQQEIHATNHIVNWW